MTSNIYNVLNSSSDDDDTNDSWRVVSKNNKHHDGSKNQSFQDLKKKNTKNKNHKKILCRNMITKGVCDYGTNCLYAHKLEEQNVNYDRKCVYDIILSTADLSNIDLQKDHELYKALLGLTILCDQCEKGKCTGGYNCKHGACMKKYQICQKDLTSGDCTDKCDKIHLTQRNLLPFCYNLKQNKNIHGMLLSPDFFKKLEIQNNNETIIDDDLSDMSESSSDNDSDNECNQSIFDQLVKN